MVAKPRQRLVFGVLALLVVGLSAGMSAHHSFAAEYRLEGASDVDRRRHQGRMDQSAHLCLHRREGRGGEDRQLGV